MNFRVDPVVVVSTLHSILEQSENRLTFADAVDRLASVGVVLPGKDLKDQVKALSVLVSLCEPSFIDARPGRNGGVGVPSVHASKSKKKSVVSDLVSKLDSEDAESDDTDAEESALDTGT